jgi:hypothetical protein
MSRPILFRSVNWRTGLPEWPYNETWREWLAEAELRRRSHQPKESDEKTNLQPSRY